MRVLRENRDSVMAMLEAFVYDPLISWRILAKHSKADQSSATDNNQQSNITENNLPFNSAGIDLNTHTLIIDNFFRPQNLGRSGSMGQGSDQLSTLIQPDETEPEENKNAR